MCIRDSATGLKVGDPVVLMGFEVGQITRIDTMEAWSEYNAVSYTHLTLPTSDLV